MGALDPLFVDVTWGAGGSTSSQTQDICLYAHKDVGLDTQMHLTCTNMPGKFCLFWQHHQFLSVVAVEKFKDDKKERKIYGCQQGELYTTKDVQPGEELLMDYSEFAEGEGFWVHGIDPTGL